MRRFLFALRFFVYSLVVASGSFVEIRVEAGERLEFYNGVRGLGMGGASIGVVNDETSLLLNPAGMGKLRDAFVTLLDVEIHTNSASSNGILTGSARMANFNSAQGMSDFLGTGANAATHYGLQAFPSFVLKNFGLGLLYNEFYNGLVDATGSNLDLQMRQDTAVVLGYNLSFFDGRIKFGFSGRYITRTESQFDNIATAGSGLDFNSNRRRGTGMALDAGLILTAPWAMLPSLSVVVRDFGNTSYEIGSTVTAPETSQQTIDAAFSLFPIHSNYVRSSFTYELRDLTNQRNENDIARRTHIGYELNLGDLLFVRAGWHQKSWTAGLEFAMEMAQLQLATYEEELGADGGTRVADRRYITKFVFRF